MSSPNSSREQARLTAIHRPEVNTQFRRNHDGSFKKLSDYYGSNVFDFMAHSSITPTLRSEVMSCIQRGVVVPKELANQIAKLVTDWATKNGATHFCHWFQPLTGSTAEKHDSFLTIDDHGKAIEKLSASALMQGEPDASSFPNGGTRSTFEARGYTGWDITSPMFLIETGNGKTLCIPTAFVSYTGEALDVKTPLLRSISKINESATHFLNLVGRDETKKVIVTCGAEQEYFLIDKAFYFSRPDLVMSGRALLGQLTARNQQMEDHYFGTIPDRVLNFMEELDFELHKLGIPAKTRHNEVAPGQFEIAPIFTEANIANDNNQLMMAMMRKVADKHGFVCLLHEKPFAGINGSGKHVNWSMADNTGFNLLEPGHNPHENLIFLSVVAIICEAVFRRGELLRAAIASAGNDHRLGANEAPPSIISIFLGDAIKAIFDAILSGKTFSPNLVNTIDLGAEQLVRLLKDNTDRNRTSPFAFTGNKFEFRAVGSSMAIGFPMGILNAAVAEVFQESNAFIESEIAKGEAIDSILTELIHKWVNHSKNIIFNGDGYSQDWVKEAAQRGLPNHRTTPEALTCFNDASKTGFLVLLGIFKAEELSMRYNIMLERYIKLREIEIQTFISMVKQYVIPDALAYKNEILQIMQMNQNLKLDSTVELGLVTDLSAKLQQLHTVTEKLSKELEALTHDEEKRALVIAQKLMPLMTEGSQSSNQIESLLPDSHWTLPKFFDMLFLR